MSTSYTASDYKGWASAGLKDYADFADCVEYVNQREDGFGGDRGQWYYADDETRTIYSGSFANDHSPGASHYTYAEVYEPLGEDEDGADEYAEAVAKWESYEEYLPTDDDEEEDGWEDADECEEEEEAESAGE